MMTAAKMVCLSFMAFIYKLQLIWLLCASVHPLVILMIRILPHHVTLSSPRPAAHCAPRPGPGEGLPAAPAQTQTQGQGRPQPAQEEAELPHTLQVILELQTKVPEDFTVMVAN